MRAWQLRGDGLETLALVPLSHGDPEVAARAAPGVRIDSVYVGSVRHGRPPGV